MLLAEEVAKRGFRRWYERQLIESHLYFVTCFLCMILVVSCIEAVSFHAGVLKAMPLVATAFAGCVVAWFAWKRYKVVMARAERLADSATCAQCGVYGALKVTGGSRAPQPGYDADGAVSAAEPDAEWVRVQCKRCGNEWTI
jgi:hypothetical protein